MQEPRTKKTPTSPKPGSGATSRPMESRKEPASSVAPAAPEETSLSLVKSAKGAKGDRKSIPEKLAPFDLSARVAALEKALMTVLVHLPAAFCEERTGADAKTERLLSRLEDRLAAGATLARLHLPEPVYDDVFEQWESLPKGSKERWKDANGKLWERFVSLGLVSADEVRS